MSAAPRPPRRPIAAVVGDGDAAPEEIAAARELGEALVDEGLRVVTGGLAGVMRAASEGARRSAKWAPGDVVGILPGYDAASANEFVDVPVCTGLGEARNVLVAATGDVLLAVAGRAGTLAEIAFAWKLGRPVIAVAVANGRAGGWAGRIAGGPVDDTRPGLVHGPLPPRDAARLARSLVSARSASVP